MNFLGVPDGFLFKIFGKFFEVCGGRIPDPSVSWIRYPFIRIGSGSGNVSYFYGSGSGSGAILCNDKAESTNLYIFAFKLTESRHGCQYDTVEAQFKIHSFLSYVFYCNASKA